MTCSLCHKKASLRCSRCGDFYCSQTCQKADWVRHQYGCRTPFPGVPDDYEDVREAMKYTEQLDVRTDADNYLEQIQVGDNAYLAASPPRLESDSDSDSDASLPLPLFEEQLECGQKPKTETMGRCEEAHEGEKKIIPFIATGDDCSSTGRPFEANLKQPASSQGTVFSAVNRRMIVPPPIDRTVADDTILADLEEESGQFSSFPSSATENLPVLQGGEREEETAEEEGVASFRMRNEDSEMPKAWVKATSVVSETIFDDALRPFSSAAGSDEDEDEDEGDGREGREGEEGRAPGSLAHRCPELFTRRD